MQHLQARRPRKRQRLVPRVKIWLETDGRYAFGFGLSKILQAVDRAGSIKQAASDLGQSYRYVWGRIKEAEAAFGKQLVETQVGGKDTQRSTLTPSARELVEGFLALRSRIVEVVEQEFSQRFGKSVSARRRDS